MNCHDVRHLTTCDDCGKLGDKRDMLTIGQKNWHGSCFIALNGIKALLEMPKEQTDKLRLDDIGHGAMRRILQFRA